MSVPQSFRQITGQSASSVTASSKDTALVVIDAQGSYATGAPLAISGVDDIQKKIAGLVETYRKASAPVIWVQHDAGSGAPVFNPDNESFDFIGTVKPKAGEKIIVKKAPSTFTGTDFHETLQKQGTKQLVITGYMAHVCVTGTARSSAEHGYDTIIIKDGIGDRSIPSADGKKTISGESLVETVCDELADSLATVIHASDVKA